MWGSGAKALLSSLRRQAESGARRKCVGKWVCVEFGNLPFLAPSSAEIFPLLRDPCGKNFGQVRCLWAPGARAETGGQREAPFHE